MTNKTKTITIAVVVAAALAVAVFLYLTPSVSAPTPDQVSQQRDSFVPEDGVITMTDVASHSSSSDCWTVIRGEVYDLTDWIQEHPGGSPAILKLCGRDGTEDFVNQHGGSENPENALLVFKIGVLSQ